MKVTYKNNRFILRNNVYLILFFGPVETGTLNGLYVDSVDSCYGRGEIIYDGMNCCEKYISFARETASEILRKNHKVFTVGSDYFVKEINTLIMLHGLTKKERAKFNKEYPEYKGIPSIDHRHVAAFEIDDKAGTMTKCDIDETGIGVKYMDKIIDRMNHIQQYLAWRIFK